MKLTPRYYQANAIDAGLWNINHKKPGGIIYMPTASGKSMVVAGIVGGINDYVGILQPQKEIFEQNYAKVVAMYPDLDVGMYSASVGKREKGKATFATIGSIINKKEDFAHIKTWIIDECHVVNAKSGMYKEFFNFIGNTNIIGLSASPYRNSVDRDGVQIKLLNRTRPRIFSSIIHRTQIDEMYGNNPTESVYLSDLVYYRMSNQANFDSSRLRTTSNGSEFSHESVVKYMGNINFYNSIIGVITRVMNPKNPKDARKKILVFAESVPEAIALTNNLNRLGIKSAVVYSSDAYEEKINKKKRELILKEFQYGDTTVLVNVKALTTGVDIPNIDCIIDANPTKSLSLYIQKIGRGARLDPNNPDKVCWVIDLVQNYDRFGEMRNYFIELYENNDSIVYRKKGYKPEVINNKYIR